ncbi:hypothetical protein A9Q86_15135 [Flavobacteriales bacterium 33_180_T64]|nr:hypothetical protein A9Q86_15135 [Flavobacteriales bacterium 33_180_T64]
MEPVVTNFNPFESVTTTNTTEAAPQIRAIDYLPLALWCIYGLGVLICILKFCRNLYQIVYRIKNNPKHKSERFINVLVNNLAIPHTFFSYIFLNKYKFENEEIPKEILLHEQTHAKQKHSIDVILLELFHIVFWFNPLLYLIKKEVRLNHEFLADRAVLNSGIQPATYQTLLLAFSSKASHQHLANAINYSSIKKRFTVMKTKTSKTSIWLRSILLLPVLAIMLYSFTDRKQVVIEHAEPKQETAMEPSPEPSEIGLTKTEIKNSNQDLPEPLENEKELETTNAQQKATPEQLAEYNNFVRRFNKQPEKQRIIKLKDLKRLKYLYNLMSTEQKKNAEPFPKFPPPPPPPPPTPKVIEVVKVMPPPAPKVIEVEKVMPPPPPPPIPTNATIEQKKQYKKIIDEYYKRYKIKNGEVTKKMPPPPPPIPKNATPEQRKKYQKTIDDYKKKHAKSVSKTKAVSVKIREVKEVLPPKSTLDVVIDMAKKKAKFIYKGKEISSDKAILLVKNNKDLNIDARHYNSKNPQVIISKEPIRIKESNPKKKTKHQKTIGNYDKKQGKLKTGFITANNKKLYYTVIDDKTTYYNRYGVVTDKKGNELRPGEQTNASNVIPESHITKVYHNDKVVSEFKNDDSNPKDIPTTLQLANKGAVFYYQGKEISGKKAIELTDNNTELNIQIINIESKKPIVKLSKEPIRI